MKFIFYKKFLAKKNSPKKNLTKKKLSKKFSSKKILTIEFLMHSKAKMVIVFTNAK